MTQRSFRSPGDLRGDADKRGGLERHIRALQRFVDTRSRMTKTVFKNQNVGTEDLSSATFTTYPTLNTESVDVPAWATKVVVTTIITKAYCVTATLSHRMQLAFGTQVSGSLGELRWTTAVSGNDHQEISMMAEFDCTAEAGTTVTVQSQGLRISGTGVVRTDANSIHMLAVEFFEE